MFSYTSLGGRVPTAHALRKLSTLIDALLATMNMESKAGHGRRG